MIALMRAYGKAIVTYLESKGIGWLGWVFDPERGPNLLQSWDTYELTGGEFFQQARQARELISAQGSYAGRPRGLTCRTRAPSWS